jgi:hypothetical protein
MTSKRRQRQERKRLARKHLMRRCRVQAQQRAAAALRTAQRMEAAFWERIENKARLQAAYRRQLEFKNIDFSGTLHNIRMPKVSDTKSAAKLIQMWEHHFPAMKEWLTRPVKPVVAEMDYAALEERILDYATRDAERTAALYRRLNEVQEGTGRYPQKARRQTKPATMAWPYGIVAGTQVRAGGAGVPTE